MEQRLLNDSDLAFNWVFNKIGVDVSDSIQLKEGIGDYDKI